MATREELMLVVDAIRGCYAGQLVNVDAKSMLSAYTAVLGELDGVDLWNAAKGIMRKFKMAPTPADIREEVLRLTVGELRSPVDAWRDVINAVGRYGSNDPVFNDPGVASCVQQLGWTNIRMGKEDAMRDAFCNLYKECARREKAKVMASPGAGARVAAVGPGDAVFDADRLAVSLEGEAKLMRQLLGEDVPDERPKQDDPFAANVAMRLFNLKGDK